MEKKIDSANNEKIGSISLQNRKELILTGVVEVINFDEEKIMLNTKLGPLLIKGSDLKMKKLDVQNGEVIIQGYINSLVYTGKEAKGPKGSIIERLFK